MMHMGKESAAQKRDTAQKKRVVEQMLETSQVNPLNEAAVRSAMELPNSKRRKTRASSGFQILRALKYSVNGTSSINGIAKSWGAPWTQVHRNILGAAGLVLNANCLLIGFFAGLFEAMH